MSASDVIDQINKLPSEEHSFDQACDVTFRENRELLSLLASERDE